MKAAVIFREACQQWHLSRLARWQNQQAPDALRRAGAICIRSPASRSFRGTPLDGLTQKTPAALIQDLLGGSLRRAIPHTPSIATSTTLLPLRRRATVKLFPPSASETRTARTSGRRPTVDARGRGSPLRRGRRRPASSPIRAIPGRSTPSPTTPIASSARPTAARPGQISALGTWAPSSAPWPPLAVRPPFT